MIKPPNIYLIVRFPPTHPLELTAEKKKKENKFKNPKVQKQVPFVFCISLAFTFKEKSVLRGTVSEFPYITF